MMISTNVRIINPESDYFGEIGVKETIGMSMNKSWVLLADGYALFADDELEGISQLEADIIKVQAIVDRLIFDGVDTQLVNDLIALLSENLQVMKQLAVYNL